MGITPQIAVAAITASRVEASLALGRTPIGVAHSSPEICWAISGIPMASFNAAIRLRTAPDPDRQIVAIQQTFAQRSMPFVWWVTQEDEFQGLEMELRSHGFNYYGDESIGMAVALSNQAQLTPAGDSASVARIFEELDIRTWFATLLESFEATPNEQTTKLAATVFSYLSNDVQSGWHLYLAYMGERPVGTCALHLGTSAGLYSVGTVPMARRQGIGTALTKHALADASSAGYSIASLTASGLGARLYRGLGFKEYCRFREYVWRPASSP
jgi:ribosomal protein S18 acetylase RimI-like enzyme